MLPRNRFKKFLLFCLIATASAGADSATAADSIKIGGTGSALGDMALLAGAYIRTHPDTRVDVLPSLGSAGGLKALRAGAIDIALTTEPLSAEEAAAGLIAVPYAKTALVFATRTDTPVNAITADWVANVYRGAVTQWPDGRPVRLVLRPAHDSDMRILFAFSDAMKQAMETALARPGLLIEDTAQGAAKKLAQVKGSLGTTTLAQVESERISVKLLAFDGVAPSIDNLVSGRYPLVKEFLYVTRPDASLAARGFIAFLKSDEAAAILKSTGNALGGARRD